MCEAWGILSVVGVASVVCLRGQVRTNTLSTKMKKKHFGFGKTLGVLSCGRWRMGPACKLRQLPDGRASAVLRHTDGKLVLNLGATHN